MESFLSLGRVHIPVYAVFAAAGLMSSIALATRTALFARIDPDAFYDLGFLSVLAALILSRLTLIVEDLHIFLQYPLAVLELPAVTTSGEFLTLLLALWYMRRRRLPFLRTADAAAPCFAILYASSELGLFFGGGRMGMPSTLPWAVSSSFGRVHPFELYSAAWYLLLATLLVVLLQRDLGPGIPATSALALGGLGDALMGFFHLPGKLYGTDVLDGGQWRGLEWFVLGGLLLAWRVALPASETRRDGAVQELPHAL